MFATIDRELGFAGITAFLVDKGTPGLTVGKPLSKMGLRTSPMSEVFLERLRGAPGGRCSGSPGAGMVVFNSSMNWERSCILASTVGAMERQLERSHRLRAGAPAVRAADRKLPGRRRTGSST